MNTPFEMGADVRNTMVGWLPQLESPIIEAKHALDALSEAPRKTLLAYTPVARMNPYQALLYTSCNEFGIAPTELIPHDKFVEVYKLTSFTDAVAVHFHWINSIVSGATDSESAEIKVDEAIQRIDRLKDQGVEFVFTLHNKISHDAQFIDSELRLQQAILDASSAVHSMSRSGIDSMKSYASIEPEKTFVAGHPTYEGVYPNFLTKHECRKALGIYSNEFVFSLFGAIKPYKGLDLIRINWEKAVRNASQPLRLIVAGSPDGSMEARTFVEWAVKEPTVTIQPTKIPFEQVQLYVKSADAGMIPYTRTLNSGSAMLHLTFGNPVVMTDEPALFEGIPSSVVEIFHEDEQFVEALLRATIRFNPSMSETLQPAFTKIFDERSPKLISRKFSYALLNRLGC